MCRNFWCRTFSMSRDPFFSADFLRVGFCTAGFVMSQVVQDPNLLEPSPTRLPLTEQRKLGRIKSFPTDKRTRVTRLLTDEQRKPVRVWLLRVLGPFMFVLGEGLVRLLLQRHPEVVCLGSFALDFSDDTGFALSDQGNLLCFWKLALPWRCCSCSFVLRCIWIFEGWRFWAQSARYAVRQNHRKSQIRTSPKKAKMRGGKSKPFRSMWSVSLCLQANCFHAGMLKTAWERRKWFVMICQYIPGRLDEFPKCAALLRGRHVIR